MNIRTVFCILGLLFSSLTQNLYAQEKSIPEQPLTAKQQALVLISTFSANGDLLRLNKALNTGLDAGWTINEIKEVLTHIYAYAGFPRSLNAINTLETVIKERKEKGKENAIGTETAITNTTKSRFDFGKDVQTKLTGSTATGSAQKFVPIIDTFLKEHLFADIFERELLDFKTREIITISALASIGRAESQLAAHFNVGMNTGLTEKQLKQVVLILMKEVGLKEGTAAKNVLGSVLSKKERTQLVIKTNERAIEFKASAENVNAIFPKGVKISNNNFTGIAWLHMLVNTDSIFNTSLGNVTFKPSARTKWHYHPGGQILIVLSGKGRYQERGKPIKELHAGDIIKCKPNIAHWHGAAPDSEFTHMAVGTNPGRGDAVWLEEVSDEVYNNINQPATN